MGQNEATGKLNILGAGWSVTTTQANGLTPNSALAVFVEVPWDRCNRELRLSMALVTEDGQPVAVPTADGHQPLVITQPLVIAPVPGAPNGSTGHHAMMINFQGGLPLSPGRWYKWRVTVDGESRDDWEARFFVRRQPSAPSMGINPS
jgi:hypothetical protein